MADVNICIYESSYSLDAGELALYNSDHRYTTQASMEAGEDIDWVSAGDRPVCNVLGSGGNWSGNPDTDAVTYTGWTVNSTYPLIFEVLDEARSSTGLLDTDGYLLSATNTTLFIDNSTSFYAHFDGLQIQNTGSAGNTFYAYDHIGVVELKNSYIDINGGANGVRHNTLSGGQGILRVWNTIVVGGTAEHIITNDDTTYIYHTLVDGESGGSFGIRGYNNDTDCHNSIAFNLSGSFDFNQCRTVDYCASDAANGTNAIDLDDNTSGEWDGAWVDWANNDYTIPDTDSPLYGVGDDLSNQFTDLLGDTDPLKYDIIGNDRSGTWDVGPFVYQAAGLDIIRVINETENVSESRQRNLTIKKIINETENLIENIKRAGNLNRIINEIENISDEVLRNRIMARINNEAIQINEQIDRKGFLTRVINETQNIIENVLNFFSLTKIINESIQLAENILKFTGIKKIINETINISTQVLKFTGISRIINESIQIIENILRFKSIKKVVNEIINISDQILRNIIFIRIQNETINITEQSLRRLSLLRIINETQNIIEGILNYTGIVKVVNESIQIAENVVKKVAIAFIIILNSVIRVFQKDVYIREFTFDNETRIFIVDSKMREFNVT